MLVRREEARDYGSKVKTCLCCMRLVVRTVLGYEGVGFTGL